MWGDLTKSLGDAIGDALAKAKSDMEKSIDSSLGIEGKGTGQVKPTESESTMKEQQALPKAASEASISSNRESSDQLAQLADQAAPASAAPGAPAPVKKKIVKKIVKKLVPKAAVVPTEDSAGGATSGQASATEAVTDAATRASTQQPGDSADGSAKAQTEVPAADQLALPPEALAVKDAPGPAALATSGQSEDTQPLQAQLKDLSEPSMTAPAHDNHTNGWSCSAVNVEASQLVGHLEAAVTTDSGAQALETVPDSAPSSQRSSAGKRTAHQRSGKAPDGKVQPEPSQSVAVSEAMRAEATAGDSDMHDAPQLSALAELPDTSGVKGRSREELEALVEQLTQSVSTREQQLVRQAQQMSDLQQTMSQLQEKNEEFTVVVAQLREKNEELALRSSKLSEQDYEEVRSEFEQRLAAAERKVYALTKERDALRKGADKLGDYEQLMKDKDAIIKQVLEEGEKLSKRQTEMEAAAKKLRAQISTLESDKERLAQRLAAEESAVAEAKRARAKAERDTSAALEQSKADLEAQREHYEALLQKAKADQVDAEERAREAAAAGLARKLKEAEGRAEALAESCFELRDALDRQRQAADLREEMMKADLADLERRCQAAELRHQELASKLPEATRPLLRQIEAMQAAAAAQSEAWAAAEATLQQRIQDAEARAATASERERHSSERAQAMANKIAALEAALAAARTEVASLREAQDGAEIAAIRAKESAAAAQQQVELLMEQLKLAHEQMEQAEANYRDALEAERSTRLAAEHDASALTREAERRAADLEARLTALGVSGGGGMSGEGGMSRGPEPPAMAAPGYRWVLVKEGEAAPTASSSSPSSSSGTHHGHGGHSHTTSELSHSGQRQGDMAFGGGSGPMMAGSSAGDLLLSLPRAGSAATGGNVLGSMGSVPLASELEELRGQLRSKTAEVVALEGQVKELEATRDRLAEELVAGAARAEAAAEAIARSAALEQEAEQMKQRYLAAIELVGERDETLDELRADLMDVKQLYKDQIEFMVQQLAELHAQGQRHSHQQHQHQQQQPAYHQNSRTGSNHSHSNHSYAHQHDPSGHGLGTQEQQQQQQSLPTSFPSAVDPAATLSPHLAQLQQRVASSSNLLMMTGQQQQGQGHHSDSSHHLPGGEGQAVEGGSSGQH